MPNEGDEKPCGESGCDGTKIFHEREREPMTGIGATGFGEPLPELRYRRGWTCDRDERHFETEK